MAIVTYALASGSTFKSTAMTDATDFSFSESSASTHLSTDGSRSVGLIVVDKKTGTVTVNGINQNLLASSSFRAGASGALVLKAKLRGAGDTTSTVLTFTFTEAVLIGSTAATPNEGNGTVSLSFEVYDSDDNGSIFAIT